MARKYLSPSLDRLFNEINARWPNRDRRTDGWFTDDRESVGHNRGARGLVHAIDVDDDGIDENFIMSHIYRGGNVLRYWIWNRGIYHSRDGFARKPYSGASPHTDHMHIEINQTPQAEQYNGHWGIAPGRSGIGPAPGNDSGLGIGGLVNAAYQAAMNEGGRDYRAELQDLGNWYKYGADVVNGQRGVFKTMRR
jgi:hypothetical protein